MNHEEIQKIIFKDIKNFNAIRDEKCKIPTSKDAKLFGENGYLDSMELITFLIDVEDEFSNLGFNISLSDERAMSQRHSPYLKFFQ